MDILAPLNKFYAIIQASLNPGDPSVSFGRFMSLYVTTIVLTWDSAILWTAIHYMKSFDVTGLLAVLNGMPLLAQGAFMSLFYVTTKAGDVIGVKPPPQA